MKSFFLLSLLLLPFICVAQKPVLDSSVFDKWPYIEPYRVKISDDGNFASWFVVDRIKNTSLLTVLAVAGGWRLDVEAPSFSNIGFSGQTFFFLTSTDSLGMITPGKDQIKFISCVSSFRVFVDNGKPWLSFSQNSNSLVVSDLSTNKRDSFPDMINYFVSPDGKKIVLQQSGASAGPAGQKLGWLDLADRKISTIWTGKNSFYHSFDRQSTQLCFIGPAKAGDELFYYKEHMAQAIDLVSSDSAYSLVRIRPSFNQKGTTVLFQLKKRVDAIAGTGKKFETNLNIWHYKDERFQEDRLVIRNPNHSPEDIYAVVGVSSHAVIHLTAPGETLIHPENFERYVLATMEDHPRAYCDDEDRPSLWAISTATGKRELIYKKKYARVSGISPDERFVIFFDTAGLSYHSYELATGVTRNISRSVPEPLYDTEAVAMGKRFADLEPGGWDMEDHSLFLYGRYDIWKIDPMGLRPALNVTRGFGRKNKLELRILGSDRYDLIFALPAEKQLLLVGYDRENKENGFWETDRTGLHDPDKLTMDPVCYTIPGSSATGYKAAAEGFKPIKARNRQRFLVRRMTAASFPNVFVSDDLKVFRQLSEVRPEKSWNWLTSELVNWALPDGQPAQGILYKPENFDPTKKYPVIFNYYEQRSDQLYQYSEPQFSSDELNIPYYVSNGYLVFVPDIHYRPGQNGQGVLDAVVSAAKYLTSFSFVDGTKLGLQGHSWGGWETNFIITHTTLFAAACTASGVADLASAYDELGYHGTNMQEYYETAGQGSNVGTGVTPWTGLKTYIENSPVFFVDKVTTPLLIEQGEADEAVPFAQAVEFFLALRRAGKKVWLLDYERAYHSLFGDDARDYTMRMNQFFDHYLKGTPPPVWMTKGIPADKKGLDTGLALDTTGKKP